MIFTLVWNSRVVLQWALVGGRTFISSSTRFQPCCLVQAFCVTLPMRVCLYNFPHNLWFPLFSIAFPKHDIPQMVHIAGAGEPPYRAGRDRAGSFCF